MTFAERRLDALAEVLRSEPPRRRAPNIAQILQPARRDADTRG